MVASRLDIYFGVSIAKLCHFHAVTTTHGIRRSPGSFFTLGDAGTRADEALSASEGPFDLDG